MKQMYVRKVYNLYPILLESLIEKLQWKSGSIVLMILIIGIETGKLIYPIFYVKINVFS